MAVIKNSDFGKQARQAIVLDLGDLRRAAQAMELEATSRARAILEEGKRQREELIAGASEKGFAEGRERGFAQGLEQGRAQGRQEALAQMSDRVKKLETAWNAALEQFIARRDDLLLDADSRVLAFAAAVAERVTKRLVSLDPSIVRDQLAAAIALAVKPSSLVVSLHPEDRPFVAELLPALVQRLSGSPAATILDDPSLARGSVIIRTESGSIDASIETQLERVLHAIVPARGPSPAPAQPADEPAEGDAP